MRTAFEQELRDLVVSVVHRRVQRFPFRRDLLFREIRIGAVFKQQLHDIDPTDGRSVRQRRTRPEIVALVVSGLVGKRRITMEQLANAIDVAT